MHEYMKTKILNGWGGFDRARSEYWNMKGDGHSSAMANLLGKGVSRVNKAIYSINRQTDEGR